MEANAIKERRIPAAVRARRLLFDALSGSRVNASTWILHDWRKTKRFRKFASSYIRAMWLIAVFFGTLAALIYWWPLVSTWLSSLGAQRTDFIEFGKGLAYPLLIILGLPVLFVLWSFRDANAREKLRHDRKDVNLKEFQELQSRAAGLFSAEMPETAVDSVQVASIFQLADFLKGEYGESFQRATYEALRTLAEQFSKRDGSHAVMQRLNRAWDLYQRRVRFGRAVSNAAISTFFMRINRSSRDINERFGRSPPVRVLTVNLKRFLTDIPLIGVRIYNFGAGKKSNWSGLVLTRLNFTKCNFAYANFSRSLIQMSRFFMSYWTKCTFDYCHAFGSIFVGDHFQRVRARRAVFEDCSFVRCMIMKCDFRFAKLDQCNFRLASISNTDFRCASMREVNLTGANLAECDLRGTDLRGIDPSVLSGAQRSRLDKNSFVCLRFDHSEGGPFEVDADLALERWLEKGAVLEAN